MPQRKQCLLLVGLVGLAAGCSAPGPKNYAATYSPPPDPAPWVRPAPPQILPPNAPPQAQVPSPQLTVPKPPSGWQPAPVPRSVTPAPQPPPKAAKAVGKRWIPLETWSAAQGLGRPRSSTGSNYQLSTAAGTFDFTAGNRTATLNGIRFQLGFAPVATNGVLYLYSSDLEKNVAPLAQSHQPLARGSRVVVIDPGHGGEDPGTRSVAGNFVEKEFALDWARRLKPLLEAGGWRVILTRSTDKAVSRADRVALADRHQADLFISLHFNSSAPSPAGLETYALTPVGMPSSILRGPAEDASVGFPGNVLDSQNVQLAMRLHRSLIQGVGMADRGVRRARFMEVLRNQKRPAVLIEAGYLSDPREAKLIVTAEYRQRLAVAVARALE